MMIIAAGIERRVRLPSPCHYGASLTSSLAPEWCALPMWA
jgi:hypothetical protein